jgi:ABC-type sugar transport system ATPase subunit
VIALRAVYFRYRRGPVILDNFTAEFPKGITTILGPNGSGKTTLLKLVAGVLTPQRGYVEVMGRPPAELRGRIAYIPQTGGLYPWMKIRDNIAIPLKIRGLQPAEISQRVRDVAEALGISHLLDRYPKEVSGGEQQKVLIARAVASGADVWLLDEPLSMIDIDYRREVIEALRKLGKTMLVITHNVQDAVDLGGYIYIVRGPPLTVVSSLAPGQYSRDAAELANAVRGAFKP